ncbi:uncharacterized protein B0H18DRAFT_30769 [Fomitopsis serialis]|uniref:uncharacterized protein n=1 Tax=Fomitopsis serialis TaxID=139415 RepID=UPI002008E386|nr:uncharacterized protein B0H18DRAFT_30769 [Neoantrodia serialis]KAH9932580.1 hypothetical protein B0H18DRAFT_30769 [Neoantrodia serialis]
MQTVLEEDAAVHALPPLSGEDRQRVQGSSLSEVREWALSKAALSPSDLYAYRLRTLYNSTLPVSRLPPETLFRIFDFFRQDCVSSMWVTKLTGICRYWRDILVSSPLAWSSIDLEHSVPFIELCLSRSADADLDVVLNETNTDPFASNAPSVKNELAPHFHRIARLELWSYSLERLQEAQLLSMLEGPMPRLTELSIWCMVPTSLQIRLNDAHFPRLQKLSLDHPSVHLYGLMLPSLTMLSLSDVARDGQPNLNTIIHLLKAAPAMRVLILRNSGPILPLSAPSPPKRPVVLNSMRVLTFHGRSTQCRALLSRLSLPRGVHIWLSVIAQPVTPSIPTDSEEYKSILDDIKLVGSLSDMRFASLQVKQRYFALRADPNRLGHRSKDPLLRIEFRNTYFITNVQSDNFFQTLLSELPLLFPQSLTSLSLDGDSMSVVDVKRWGQTLYPSHICSNCTSLPVACSAPSGTWLNSATGGWSHSCQSYDASS